VPELVGLTKRKRLLAVGRRHLGDHEIPGADDLLLETLRRLRGGAGSHDKREQGGGDDPQCHSILRRCVRAHYFNVIATPFKSALAISPTGAAGQFQHRALLVNPRHVRTGARSISDFPNSTCRRAGNRNIAI
jgi:hypothetical protein